MMDTKKLRQKILDLAIRGKLVPQDPNDEPASVLLERIREEKERLIKEGKIKRSKMAAKDDIEPPFEIPESWEWTTIGEIASSILYGVSESAKESGNYKLLRITDIQNNRVNWETVPFTNYDENKVQPYLLQDGDILFARTGATVGKSYLVEGLLQPSIYASYLIRVQTSGIILPSYIKLFFESGYYWEQITLSSVGIGQPNVNGTTLAALSIPIPPLAEQQRIANEIERWFAAIDELESNEADLQNTIDKAKSKILDLAIRGKLVPQDPNDEPASVLLQHIREEKERLIKEGKIKRSKTATANNDIEPPFEIPESWEWVTIEEICSKIGSGSTPKGSNYSQSGIPFFRSQNVYNEGLIYDDIKFISEEVHNSMKGTEVIKNDLLLNITGGSLGRCAIVPDNFERGNVSQHVCILRPIIVLPSFLHAFIISDYFSSTMILSGSGREGLPKYSLEIMSFPLPPLAEQKRIVAKIEELFAVLDSISAS